MCNSKVEQAIKMVLSRRNETENFGRTKIMKYLYFLKAEGGLDVGTEFELYTWGPFSKEVLFVLDQMSNSDQPAIRQDQLENGEGYNYTLLEGDKAMQIRPEQQSVLEKLSSKNSKDLEALSTLHLVKKQNKDADEATIIDWVKSLKPYFRREELKKYYKELADLDWD